MKRNDGDQAGLNMKLDASQRVVIVGLERTGGSLSIISVIAIIVTFILFKRMRTVPNTFILFASIANIGASIAAIIGLDGLDLGKTSALCQAQAFLLEMFMQSDSWWSFAMAVNVFMVFFFHASPDTFRQYLWAYCIICYGLPMVPAIVCLFAKADGPPIYGDATLWCWIDDSWNSLRIFSYYLPIWICIFLSAIIYILVGYHVFHQRNQLRNLSLSNPGKDSISDVRDSAEKNLTSPAGGFGPSAGYYGTVTTEVQITSDICRPREQRHYYTTAPTTPAPSTSASAAIISPSNAFTWAAPDDDEDDASNRSNTVVAGGSQHHHHHHHHYHHHHHHASKPFSAISNVVSSPSPSRATLHPSNLPQTPLSRSRTTSTATGLSRPSRALRRFRAKLRNTDPVKLAYLRTSFVFAISVLVTWTPSSINRVYNMIQGDKFSFGLNIASAAVLPLQGVWNAIIYFSTSHALLRDELRAIGYRRGWGRPRWLWGGKRLDSGGVGAGGGRRGSEGIAPDRHVRFGAGELWERDDSTEMELRCPRVCTVRVQKGGELDV